MIQRRRTRKLLLAAAVANVAVLGGREAQAQDWAIGLGGSWSAAANWVNPGTVPDAVGAVANFTPINTANRTITNDAGSPGFTVGAINFDLQGAAAFTNSLTLGTANSNLKLDNGGAGATITTTGNGTGNNTISVPLSFNDNVTATVNQTASTSQAGSLNLTATITGSGGFTKTGDGLVTFGTGAKTYTGATFINGGRIRMSGAAQPASTSGFTINNGGQLTIIQTTTGNFTLGPGVLALNGAGPTTGPFAAFPGAIRNDTGTAVKFNNNVVLQSDTLIHVQGQAAAIMTFSGNISGPGKLTITATNSNQDIGRVVLTSANTWSGGTLINAGQLVVTDPNGLGTGPLTVNSAVPGFAHATLVQLSSTGPSTSGSLSGTNGGDVGDSITIDNGGQTYTVNQTANGLYAGTIQGAGGLALGATSTATLTLSGALTYTGVTTVPAGKIALATNLTSSTAINVTGGTLELTAGAGNLRVIRTPSLSVTGGRLDIQDNKIITQTPIGSATAGVYDGVSGMIQAGRNGNSPPLWDGNGIVTSQSDATGGSFTSVGVATAQQAKNLATASDTAVWGGQTVTGTDTLVMYTYGGDANLDGRITVDDYGKIDFAVGLPGASGWANGDFNYDGKITVDDYGIIDFNVGIQGAQIPTGAGLGGGLAGVSAVPEPGSLAALGVGIAAMVTRRRRSRA
jgi:autotransporter-associated beta strand protein